MSKAASKSKKGTVGTQFKTSLAELMSEMSVAAPHFVRCIKSNERKVTYVSFVDPSFFIIVLRCRWSSTTIL